ncbi:hypothetical protein PGTUg99_005608 [Puccinia graminis f. sp. tritici]|uniref:Uncharacterized protein n=1 Tax=Puccinia graminis f. sp. tritici TaxID=56615 RepID=A0A5B0RCH0_PUCGR|nr:hypothetical protein PGTUg99_005608 [Puccinia graminis f. sp. tritici]
MRFTFLTLTASLLLLNHQAFAGEDNIDPPLNSTSTIQSFSFQRKLSWTNQDFDVTQDGNNAHIMSVEAHLKDKWMKAHFALDLVLPSGERVGIKVEGKLVHCGFTQTYKISNGVQLLVDPRGTSTDRWYIKKSGYIKQAYTWHRHFQGLSGVVTGEHGRKVAYFSAKTWGSAFLAGLSHSKWPQTSRYTIKTNGEVPLEILVALYVSAAVRKDLCSW